ncbi:hypothetical protein C0081_08965 [Cohaesibacter celericrescens]|uniref:Uncharacterized protein n=2 Tax=Cohaesibacter celericrescens TaxID=2067669 RepID=A0A2N5XSG8_9HYPH|nr:hypothetical protein C0081_08965 [Cohaesibacter celericrescens]
MLACLNTRLPTLFLASLMSLSAGACLASQVTTERIITLPDYSASSPDTSPILGPNGEGSGGSRISIDGEITSETPDSDDTDSDIDDTPDMLSDQPVFTGPLPTIMSDIDALPMPVQNMHKALYRAALSGTIEALRTPIEMNEMPPILGLEEGQGDPIEQLRQMTSAPDGAEILAILAEILESNFVLIGQGTPQEMYVWPYFAHYPVSALTAPQRVELFRLITSGDYEEMDALGQYIFFRVGIAPDGTWHYFVAGE